jgi:hypothetical protein
MSDEEMADCSLGGLLKTKAKDYESQLAAQACEIVALREALKDSRMRCGELDASDSKLREALPALWGQYDDEGRKLWIDPSEVQACEIVALREDIARLRRELWDACNTDPAEAMRAKCDRLRSAVIDLLPHVGWHNLTDVELRREGKLGNGMAPVILRARAALKGNGEGK